MRKLFTVLLTSLCSALLLIPEAGIVSAQANSTSELTAESTTTNTSIALTGTPGVTNTPGEVVQISTPAADGSIIHIVRAGETLITIAEAYGVSLGELYELNGMNQNSVIYPGEELVIREGSTATPTSPPTRTSTPTKIPTSTRRPIRTPHPQVEGTTGGAVTQTPLEPTLNTTLVQEEPDRIGNILLGAIALLGAGGLALILLGSVLRRSS